MSCLLCFESNNDYIELESDESIQLKIGSVLFKHFRFVFDDEPQNGRICRKCWLKVDIFHEFYGRIEEIHTTVLPNVVIIENLIEDLKNHESFKSETNEFDRFSDGGDIDTDAGFNDPAPSNSDSDDELLKPKSKSTEVETKVERKSLKQVEQPKNDNCNWYKMDESSSETNDDDDDDDDDDDEVGKTIREKKTSFQCNFCQKIFSCRSRLHRHMKDLHYDNIFECNICRRVLLSEKSLNRHIRKLHTKRKYSDDKKKTFKSFQCQICFEYFLTENHLNRHKKITHMALPFKCNHTKCIESFETAKELDDHKTEVHAKSSCQYCGKQVMTIFMEQHYERMHNKDKQVICDQCGKVFPNAYILKSHVQSEHDAPERLQCDICKGTFRNKHNLQKHLKIIHIDRPQTCHICGKISPNSKALQSHLYVHKEPDKECLVCGKRFKQASKLREHSYTHSGISDAYECNFCGKKFRFGSSWSAHKMKYHPAEMIESKERLERIKRNAMKKTGNFQS